MKRILLTAILTFGMAALSWGEDIITLGALGEEGELLYPAQIEEGPDGNIYVYDQVDVCIKVYSSEGKFLRKIGGQGQGPGEIQRADGVSFGFAPDEKLFFTEFFGGHPWMTFMELTGEFIRVLKFELKVFFGVGSAESLPDGSFLVEFAISGKPEKIKDYFLYRSPIELVLLGLDGKMISKIKTTNYFTRISSVGDGADSPLPFTPVFSWSLFKDNTVLFSDGLSPRFEVYDYSGKRVGEIVTPLPQPKKVTKKDLNKWRNQRKEMMSARDSAWYKRFGSVIEKYKKSIYEVWPNIRGISVSPEGNILVAGAWNDQDNRGVYWLLTQEGGLIAKASSSADSMRMTKDFILLTQTEEDSTIKVCCLKRTGSEKQDFVKISKKT